METIGSEQLLVEIHYPVTKQAHIFSWQRPTFINQIDDAAAFKGDGICKTLNGMKFFFEIYWKSYLYSMANAIHLYSRHLSTTVNKI